MHGAGPRPLAHFFEALLVHGHDFNWRIRRSVAADGKPKVDSFVFNLGQEGGVNKGTKKEENGDTQSHPKGRTFTVMDFDFSSLGGFRHGCIVGLSRNPVNNTS